MPVAAGKHVVDASFEDQLAAIHDGDTVADLFDLTEEMRAKDDGLALGAHGVDHAADRGGTDGVDACGGLVEDDEFRIMDDRLRETDALQHTFGIRPDRPVGGLGHRRQAEGVLDGGGDVGGRHAAQLGAVTDQLPPAEELMKIRRLRQEAGASTGLRRGGGAAEDGDLARSGGNQSQYDLQRGALAATVRTQQAVDLTARDLQRDIVDGAELEAAEADPEIFRQMADRDGRTHRRMEKSVQVRRPAKVLISSPRMCPSRDLAIWSVKASTSVSAPSACR